ncbi:MAG TPA: hypothetical protein VMT53_07640 [Terriglobales bacterium]|nr:hypothetical protein [Terriglobales bacterium]
MADAKITTSDGISVEVHGSPEEVATVVERLRSGTKVQSKTQSRKTQHTKDRAVGGIPDLVTVLKEEDFFRVPKGLGEVRKKLAEMGHHYPLTTLSGAMQTQAKKRSLRRFKQDGKYVYVSA